MKTITILLLGLLLVGIVVGANVFTHTASWEVEDSEDTAIDAAEESSLRRRRQADQEFIQAALELSNKFRAKHGAPALEICEDLNAAAQAYAEEEAAKGSQKHSCDPCDKYGENLAYKGMTGEVPCGIDAAEFAVNEWYNEVSLYNFDNPNMEYQHKWGHFTQLVWKSTTTMGIGVAYGTKKSKSGRTMNTIFVVARYEPPGNNLDPETMKEKVRPAK